MKDPIQNLKEAMHVAMTTRPEVGGFTHLAETLRQAGVTKNTWSLPSCQSTYITGLGNVVMVGNPLATGMDLVPAFDQDALVRVLRADQAGETSFEEFLLGAWKAGCVSYEVDFVARRVTYFGAEGEVYVEEYPAVSIEPS